MAAKLVQYSIGVAAIQVPLPLSAPDSGMKLRLGRRQDSELITLVSHGQLDHRVCTRLVYVQLDQCASIQVVNCQVQRLSRNTVSDNGSPLMLTG